MSTEPITQALQRVELAGAYHRAARARQLGVPQIEITALEHLDAHGALTPGELGHRLGLTSGGVTALTGRMIDAGYVTRERHPGDGRMRMLTVTPAGAERLREHLEPVSGTPSRARSPGCGATTRSWWRACWTRSPSGARPPRRRRLGRSGCSRPTATRARS